MSLQNSAAGIPFIKQYRQAGRSAGLAGLDSVDDAQQALNTVDGVERELKKMRGQVKDPKVKSEIDELLREITTWKQQVQ